MNCTRSIAVAVNSRISRRQQCGYSQPDGSPTSFSKCALNEALEDLESISNELFCMRSPSRTSQAGPPIFDHRQLYCLSQSWVLNGCCWGHFRWLSFLGHDRSRSWSYWAKALSKEVWKSEAFGNALANDCESRRWWLCLDTWIEPRRSAPAAQKVSRYNRASALNSAPAKIEFYFLKLTKNCHRAKFKVWKAR